MPLRLLGCVATVLTILGAAHVARRLGGRGAAGWAALAAAALLVTPLTGAQSVNGELLAAPFVIWGIAAAVHALQGGPPRHAPRRCRGCRPRLLGDGQAELRGRRRVRRPSCGALALWRRELTAARARNLLAGLRPRRGRRAGCRLRLDAGQRHLPRRRVRRDVPLPPPGGTLLASPPTTAPGCASSPLLFSWLICGGRCADGATAWALWRAAWVAPWSGPWWSRSASR